MNNLRLTLSLALVVAYAGFTVDQAMGQCSGSSSCKNECAAAKCPVSGGKISKDASIDYKGGKVYFCCEGCISKFKEDKAKYEAKANEQLVITGQAKQVGCPVCGEKPNCGYKLKVCGIDVCFCGEGCMNKVKNASAEEQCKMVFVKGFDKAFVVKQEKKEDK